MGSETEGRIEDGDVEELSGKGKENFSQSYTTTHARAPPRVISYHTAGEMLLLGFVAVVVYLLMSLREGPTRGGWKDLGLESMRASSVPAQAKHTKSALDWLWILVNCVTLVIYAWHRTNDGSLVYFTQVGE